MDFICYNFRHINEDRRKTESQVVMFEIMNDIEDCPVSLWLGQQLGWMVGLLGDRVIWRKISQIYIFIIYKVVKYRKILLIYIVYFIFSLVKI